jgi:hypothetical protein
MKKYLSTLTDGEETLTALDGSVVAGALKAITIEFAWGLLTAF